MPRVTVELPDHFEISMEAPVLYNHINAGGHLGNDLLLGLLNDVRMHYFQSHSIYDEEPRNWSPVVADMAVVYSSEAFFGEHLKVELAEGEKLKYGRELLYRVTEIGSQREVARIRTNVLVMDTTTRKVRIPPAGFMGH